MNPLSYRDYLHRCGREGDRKEHHQHSPLNNHVPAAPQIQIRMRQPVEAADQPPRITSSANAIFSKYRDEKNKFSGSLSENWSDAVDEFNTMTNALHATEEQKLEWMPIILAGDARRFFNTEVSGLHTTFAAASKAITAKFHDAARQHRVKGYLLSRRLEKFESETIGPRDALVRLIAELGRFFIQTPATYQCEDNKITIIRTAVFYRRLAIPSQADFHKPGSTFSSFRLSKQVFRSMGTIHVRIPTPVSYLSLNLDVVDAPVP